MPILFSACRTIEDTTGLPPVVEYVGSRGEFFLRPLVSVSSQEVRCVWPIFRHRYDERGRSMWLLPVLYYVSKPREAGYDRDLFIFPVVFWGDSPGEGSHFALFPAGGTIKPFMGKDEMVFALFPLYLCLKSRENRSHHVLWPLVNWMDGGGRTGWRFWPLYATYRGVTLDGRPKFHRDWVLWPLFSHQRYHLDTKAPIEAWVAFPFYSQIESKHLSRRNVCWPLFSYEEDRKRNYRSWGMPVLPIRYARGDDEWQLDVWPVYGHWERSERYRQFALWPVQRYETEKGTDVQAERFYLLPFWWESDVTWPPRKKKGAAGEGEARFRKRRTLWPLFASEEENDRARWDVLSLLPWFDEDTERFWGRFWTLARYRSSGKDEAFELLWGLFSWESGPVAHAWRFAGGLFGTETDAAGATTYRVFFIPIGGGG